MVFLYQKNKKKKAENVRKRINKENGNNNNEELGESKTSNAILKQDYV